MKVIELSEGIIVQLTAVDPMTPLKLPQVSGSLVDIINKSEGIFRSGSMYKFVYITNNQFFIEFEIDEADIYDKHILNLLK
jgi:hypothetical protein